MRRAAEHFGGVHTTEADLASKSSSVTCCVTLGKLPKFSEPCFPISKMRMILVPTGCKGWYKGHHEVISTVCS